MKIVDLINRSAFSLLFEPRRETYFYWIELFIGIIIPIIIFSQKKWRESRRGLFVGSTLVILGFIMNRMNISLTGMEGWAGIFYFPSWMEIAITFSIVTAGFIIFSFAVKELPIFKPEPETSRKTIMSSETEEFDFVSHQNINILTDL